MYFWDLLEVRHNCAKFHQFRMCVTYFTRGEGLFTPHIREHSPKRLILNSINGAFSRDSLPRIKDGAYEINLDENQSKGTHWASLFIDKHMALYFHSFDIEYILQEVLNKIKDKSIIHNLFRIQDEDSTTREFFCIAFL